ncbi:MAG: protein kinase [Synergistaceae bacterium]|nr:protein kinase [Synergistaceae bacterium]
MEDQVTRREFSDESPTMRESAGADSSDITQIYGAPYGGQVFTGALGTFRGWTVLQQLPTKGAEADIYVVSRQGANRVLKLYRHRLEPKAEILNRITEISRANSGCFVVFYETGFDEETGRWYELQEYIPLGSLRDIPQETKGKAGFVSAIAPELANAIHCLHENGIIHCDIKPANILIRSLEPLDIVLTDFGISSLLAADASMKMTSLKGTPMYWAPEAFSREIGRPCDWWGMGMVLLELLAGEHPFEGLSDSRIIHRLTLGNVEIPPSINPDWTILLMGLLTKNDKLRWGKGEIDKWMEGDRTVPVFYESAENAAGPKPFRFEGVDYPDTASLCEALSRSEHPWFASFDYLRYIRTWLENNLKFEEAMDAGNMISGGDPEAALFRFIHGKASLPFSVMGHIINARSLSDFLDRSIDENASDGEYEITRMLHDGRLLGLYREYARISGHMMEDGLESLLKFLSGKDFRAQRDYLAAACRPDEFVWPLNAPADSIAERIELLANIGMPVRKDVFESVRASYAIPYELAGMMDSAPSYASGAARLESWMSHGLLMPRSSEDEDEACANLGVGEYERMARIYCLGHTSVILDQIEYVASSIAALPFFHHPLSFQFMLDTITRINLLKDRKVTRTDITFIMNAAKLFEERADMTHGRMARYALYTFTAGTISWMLCFLGGDRAISALRYSLLVSMTICGTHYVGFVRNDWAPDLQPRYTDALWCYFGVLIFVPFLMYNYIISNHPHVTTFLTGAAPASIFLFGTHIRNMARNAADIMNACETYNREMS